MEGKEEWIAFVYTRYTRFITFETKEEAITAGRAELKRLKTRPAEMVEFSGVFEQLIDKDYSKFYVGRIERPVPKITADSIIKKLRESSREIYGDFCGDFMESVTAAEKAELDNMVNVVVKMWIRKNALKKYGFLVKDIEEIADIENKDCEMYFKRINE